jgi:hypothetical protein
MMKKSFLKVVSLPISKIWIILQRPLHFNSLNMDNFTVEPQSFLLPAPKTRPIMLT